MNPILFLIIVIGTSLLSGCATLAGGDGPIVRVVGMQALPSEGLEVRFELKLRVQNPNETPLLYDGMSVRLDLDGRGLASGVSNTSGEIPRFSDAVLTVPVSISAFSVVRQLLARAEAMGEEGVENQPIAYSLKGKLGAPEGSFKVIRFVDTGDLNIFSPKDQ